MLLHTSLGNLDVSGRKLLRALLQGVKKDEDPARRPEVHQAVTVPPVLGPQLADFSSDLTRIRKGQGRSLLGEERDDRHDLRSARLVEAIEEILYRALALIALKELDRPGAFTGPSFS